MVSWWPFSESLYDEPGDWSTTLPWLCSSCARWPLMTSACAGVITGEFKFCQPSLPTAMEPEEDECGLRRGDGG